MKSVGRYPEFPWWANVDIKCFETGEVGKYDVYEILSIFTVENSLV